MMAKKEEVFLLLSTFVKKNLREYRRACELIWNFLVMLFCKTTPFKVWDIWVKLGPRSRVFRGGPGVWFCQHFEGHLWFEIQWTAIPCGDRHSGQGQSQRHLWLADGNNSPQGENPQTQGRRCSHGGQHPTTRPGNQVWSLQHFCPTTFPELIS